MKKSLSSLQSLKLFDLLDCAIIYVSSNSIVYDANDLAIKLLKLSPTSFRKCNLIEHCNNNGFSLTSILNKKTSSSDTVKETYTLPNESSITLQWKKVTLPDNSNDSGNDLLVVGFDITLEQIAINAYKDTIFFYETILSKLPTNVYWKDENCVYMGCNDRLAHIMGLPSRDAIKGMTDFDFDWGPNAAESFIAFDKKVMSTGQSLTTEDVFKEANGNVVTVLTNKTPLKNKMGKTVGVLAISVDITDRKKMEEELKQSKENLEAAIAAKLKAEEIERKITAESAARKAQLAAQEQFTKLANQVAHDIRSPLASLLMIVKACEEIPERERIALRAASTRISDIANNLLHQYRVDKPASSIETDEKRSVLLSATLLQLLTEKKFEYQDSPVEFNCQFNPTAQFAFISIEHSAFKRMVSNLINNAVDAFVDHSGIVTLKVDATKEWANVIVSDNGKGMSSALIEKIMNNMSVSEGKVDGNGIGLTQVRETLARNKGTLSIHSKIGKGTAIQIKFPRVKAPLWVAEEIMLGREDIVVILDDDRSIHGAWDSRFEGILKQAPHIKLHHFENGQEGLTFLTTLDRDEKKKTLLLTDFELLKQSLNGLDVVERANLSRSILVTSHYDDPDIQKRTHALGTKILPKQLASEIPMIFIEAMNGVSQEEYLGEVVRLVIVDDDVRYVDDLIYYSFQDDKGIVHFQSPEELLENLAKYPKRYPKDTKICLDNNFGNSDVNGVELAKELHAMGYTQLYLITGDTFAPGDLPEYLAELGKSGIEKIKDW
jgi:PAS domain S-box-containing protein